MSRQPEDFNDYREMIREGYLECEFPKFKAGYQRYVIMGGEAGPDAFKSWVDGATEPQATNLSLMFKLLNTRLTELGKPAWLPDLPLLGRGGNGIHSTGTDSDIPGYPYADVA